MLTVIIIITAVKYMLSAYYYNELRLIPIMIRDIFICFYSANYYVYYFFQRSAINFKKSLEYIFRICFSEYLYLSCLSFINLLFRS